MLANSSGVPLGVCIASLECVDSEAQLDSGLLVYALLVTYQALRIAITDATIGRPDVDPDRGSFTIALNAARDQLVKAAGVIAGTVIDLVGTIGRHVLDNLMPDRRLRTTPRVVKRAISNYAAKTALGRIRGPSYKATININILAGNSP